MILFKPFFVSLILNDTKTVTRRAGKKRWNKNSIHQARTTYKSHPFAHLKITSEPSQSPLNKITPEDAQQEGGFTVHSCLNKTIDKIFIRTICNNCDHSKTCFQKIYVKCVGTWNPKDTPWVVKFKRVEPQKRIILSNVVEI